jgi:hypothetical protein
MNEIAKLLKVCDRFWEDVKKLFNDINNIMLNDFGMKYYEFFYELKESRRIYSNFYKDKSLIYITFDYSVDIPFIQIYYLNKINKNTDLDETFLNEKYKGWYPLGFIDEDKYEIKKISKYFFSILIKTGECFVSEKIDIMSIDSSDIVNTEIKTLIEVFIKGEFEQYETKKLKFLIE